MMPMTFSVSDLPSLFVLLGKLADVLLPALATLVQDVLAGRKTAEEADAEAEGKFTSMLAVLANPKADSAALNAIEDAKLDEKFPPPADKEETKT